VRFDAAVRIRAATGEVCKRHPDVILFQEVWLESLAEEIIGHCQTEGYSPAMSAQGGRSTGGLVTLYRTSNWSLVKSAFTPFQCHAPALRVWEGDAIGRKGVLLTVLANVKIPLSVTVANTHLQAQYGEHHYPEVRAAQVSELESSIADSGSAGRPVILAGDFNTTPADPLYSRIAQRWIDLTAGYRQRCERDGRKSCGTSFDGELPKEWVDYIFVRRGDGMTAAAVLQLIRNKKLDDPFSDHEGLQADLSIAKSSAASRAFGQLVRQVSDPRLLTRRNSLDILRRVSDWRSLI
jgi:endonuclease/exonuclease/phosphatase family metal-dependent hydrolase